MPLQTCLISGSAVRRRHQNRIPIAEAIQKRFDGLDYLFDLGPLELNISGCVNSCGYHHIGHIGILGVDKNDEEWYQITSGGREGTGVRMANSVGGLLPGSRPGERNT